MADVLVAYFSRSGTAEGLAKDLAARLEADLDAIGPAASYRGALGAFKGGWQALCKARPRPGFSKHPGHYRCVVLVTPVWVGALSPPARGWLARFAGQIPMLAAVWVSGSGAPYDQVGAEIERLSDRTLIGHVSFGEREARRGERRDKLDALARAVRRALEEAEAPAA